MSDKVTERSVEVTPPAAGEERLMLINSAAEGLGAPPEAALQAVKRAML
jgi:hypothetical protein